SWWVETSSSRSTPSAPVTAQATATPRPAAAAPAAPAPQAAQPKRGGSMNLVLVSEPPHWDPHRGVKFVHLWDYIGEGILNYDAVSGDPMGELAEKWEYTNPTTLVLHVRKGVKWQNIPPVSGREFTADDIVWNIQRIGRPGATYAWKGRFERVAKAEATDKYTVKLTLKAPFAPMLNYLRGGPYPFQPMLPREVEDKFGEDGFKDAERAISTGPFMIKNYTPGVGGSFVRNPDYRRPGLPYMDGLQVYVVPDEATLTAAYRAGKIDFGAETVGGVDLTAKKDLERTHPTMKFFPIPATYPLGVSMNLRKPPFDNVKLRKALFLAMDRQEALKINLGGGGHISGPMSPRGFVGWTWSEQELLKREGFRPKDSPEGKQDIAEAQKLMRELGYGPDKPLVLEAEGCKCFPWVNLTNTEVAKSQWKNIYVDLKTIKVVDQVTWFDQDTSGNWFLRSRGYNTAPEPDDQLYTRYFTGAGRNYIGFSDPAIDKLLEAQRMELDIAKRKAMMMDVQEKIWQQYPFIWLHVAERYAVVQPWVKNLEPTAWRMWGDPAVAWKDR
ncbi:MAG: ABC transporter substrate-binding protein, partial [Chloroflexota bacterium]